MSSVPYVSLVANVSKLGDILTIFINFILIYVTHFHIKEITKAYKSLIILFASLGIVFSVIESIVQPFMHSYNSSFNYFTTSSVFGASKKLKTALLLLYSCLYAVFICLIALQFFYRFLLITDSPRIKLFSRSNVHWLFLYVSLGVGTWIFSITSGAEDTFTDDYLRVEMMTEYNCQIEQVPGYYMIIYEEVNGIRHFHQNGLIYVGGVSLFLVSQYSVILYCSLNIQKKITCLMRSQGTHRIQRQLFRTLVIQTLTPSLFHHFPIFLVYLLCFFDWNISFPSGVMISFFSFFPVADSLILMSLVAEYRNVFRSESSHSNQSAAEVSEVVFGRILNMDQVNVSSIPEVTCTKA